MGTINGCGTRYYGSDYTYQPSTNQGHPKSSNIDIIHQENLKQSAIAKDVRIIKLTKRKEELTRRVTELSFAEHEELRRINPQIEAIENSYITNEQIESLNPVSIDSYVATKWFVIFMLPIFPIQSAIIHGYPPVTSTKGGRWRTTEYNMSDVPLHMMQVVKTYALVYGTITLFLVTWYIYDAMFA